MISGLDHIAIIVSDFNGVEFYQQLGFEITEKYVREHDVMLFMRGNGITLEVFVSPAHPCRVTNPEALGLRHLCFKVDNVEKTLKELKLTSEEIRTFNGRRFAFVKDPDGLPIELHE